MNQSQIISRMNQAFENHNALVLEVGDAVQARVFDGTFVNAYVRDFDSENVVFQTASGFQWAMPIEQAELDTFLIARYVETGRAKLIEEIKRLWLAKVA